MHLEKQKQIQIIFSNVFLCLRLFNKCPLTFHTNIIVIIINVHSNKIDVIVNVTLGFQVYYYCCGNHVSSIGQTGH